MTDPADSPDQWVTSAVLSDVAATLSGIDALRTDAQALSRAGPAVGSTAGREVNLKPPIGEMALVHASTAWFLGADHVIAAHRLLAKAKTQTMAAHATLARSAIEGAVVTRWLMEPGLDAVERRWRGAAAQLEDHRQRMLFERAAGLEDIPRPPPAKSGRYRLDELSGRLKASGLWARHGSRPTMPEVTRLFSDYAVPAAPGRGEWIYRALSAFAHGKQWGALLGEIHEREALPGTSLKTARMGAGDQLALAAARITMVVLERALVELAVYLGRQTDGEPLPGEG